MKTILCSQRIEYISEYNETRDCLDEKWIGFINSCGFAAVPVPNNTANTEMLLKQNNFSGILLTGGNSICSYEKGFLQKDENDSLLISYAEKNDVPVFGVCRGMQSILDYYKIRLEEKAGHIRTTHSIDFGYGLTEVNSFHRYCATSIPEQFDGVRTADGTYEMIKHKSKRIAGIMWHPERYDEYRSCDIRLVKSFFDNA